MSSLNDFSVAIGIESGDAKNIERVLDTLERIKKIDAELQHSKLAKDITNFDLKKMATDAGFDELRTSLEVANESLRAMLQKTEMLDKVLGTSGVLTEKLDAMKEELGMKIDSLGGIAKEVKSLSGSISRMKGEFASIRKAVEGMPSPKDYDKQLAGLEEKLGGLESSVENMGGKVTMTSEKVTIMETSVPQRITGLQEAINNMKVLSEAMNKKIEELHFTQPKPEVRVETRTVYMEPPVRRKISIEEPEEEEEEEEEEPEPAKKKKRPSKMPFSWGTFGPIKKGTGRAQKSLSVFEAEKMYEQRGEYPPGRWWDDLKQWIDAQNKKNTKELKDAINKRDEDKQAEGESVLNEDDR